MEFRYEKKFENNEQWYTVGVIKELIKDEEIYAVEVMDPAGRIMCDAEKWTPGNVAVAVFGITDDEYNLFSEDIDAFSNLVERLKTDIPKDRLFSERNCVRQVDRKNTIDENGKFKKYLEEKVKKHAPEKTPGMVISKLLSAQKLCVAYSADTDRPVLKIVNDNANLILTENEETMDKFLENQSNLYKKVFSEDEINTEGKDSIFVYFYKIGINMLGYLFEDNRIMTFPMEAVIKSYEYKANKPSGVANPELDRYATALFQILRTAKLDDEKSKETFNKTVGYLDMKITEKIIDGQFLLGQKLIQHKDGTAEASLSVIEQKETKEKLLPVASCDEEYNITDESFKGISVSYEKLKEIVEKSGLAGFVVNCGSKCTIKFNRQKIEQAEKFKKWREAQEKKK